jgi:hypothetical protein
MKALVDLITSLISRKFYGELRVKFHAGGIAHVEQVESLDVSQFQPNK